MGAIRAPHLCCRAAALLAFCLLAAGAQKTAGVAGPTEQTLPIGAEGHLGSPSAHNRQGPRWCNALNLEGPVGACSDGSSTYSGRTWLPRGFHDDCGSFMLLLLLLVLADVAELLWPKLWRAAFAVLPPARHRSFAARDSTECTVNLRAELAALEQQQQQLQQQQQQYTSSADFAAFALLQRQIDKLTRAKEVCLKQLQQQQQQSSLTRSENGLRTSIVWSVFKPVVLAHGWTIGKVSVPTRWSGPPLFYPNNGGLQDLQGPLLAKPSQGQ